MLKFTLLFAVLLQCQLTNTILCYNCHQTTKACLYGHRNALNTINCTNSHTCTSLFYSTLVDNVTSVKVAQRGCSPDAHYCNNSMPSSVQHGQHRTGLECSVCSTDLCNTIDRRRLSALLFTLCISIELLLT